MSHPIQGQVRHAHGDKWIAYAEQADDPKGDQPHSDGHIPGAAMICTHPASICPLGRSCSLGWPLGARQFLRTMDEQGLELESRND